MTAASRAMMVAALNETRLVREPLRLAFHAPRLLRTTARPAPVIVLPGLGADDASTAALRWYLRRIGHHVDGWDLGRHQPHVLTTLRQFSRSLGTAVERVGEPITLVGWSLGGVIARETARDNPDRVAQVITFGSPINGPRATSRMRASSGSTTSALDRMIASRGRRPIRVPVTTIYSRRDGIVDWRSSVDNSPNAVNIEVGSSHLGLGLDPDVWRIVADTIDADTIDADTAERRTATGSARGRYRRRGSK